MGWTLDRARLLTEASVSNHISIPDAAYFDPMHIYYVDGIFNHHFGLMMYELRKTAFNYNFVDAYVKLWEWPAAVAANHGKAVCERGHLHLKSKKLSCTASEGRSLLPVLANLVANTRIAIGDYAVAFLALARCLELCDATARRHVDPQHLRDCIAEHAEHSNVESDVRCNQHQAADVLTS